MIVEVETLLGSEPPIPREAWQPLKGWYKAAVERALPPARFTLKQITEERVDLYSYAPSPGTNIPISVKPVLVDDSVPTEDDIADKSIRGAVRDEGRAPEKVDSGSKEEEERGGRGRGRDKVVQGRGIEESQLGEVSGPGTEDAL